MAQRSERARETVAGADHHIRRGPHGSANQDRLADRRERGRQIRMTRTERARRALTVHKQPFRRSVDSMLLDLAGVVRHIVEQSQLGVREDRGKYAAHQ